MESLKHTNFHFLISDGPTFFDTSDNTSFTFIRPDGLKEGLMPITPRILMVQGKCTEAAGYYPPIHGNIFQPDNLVAVVKAKKHKTINSPSYIHSA